MNTPKEDIEVAWREALLQSTKKTYKSTRWSELYIMFMGVGVLAWMYVISVRLEAILEAVSK